MAKWVKVVELAGFMKQEGIEHLRELAKAEDEDRLLILPCKVGDRIYRVVPNMAVSWPDPIEYKVIWSTFEPNDIYEFGKKIFLTHEEAEDRKRYLNKLETI